MAKKKVGKRFTKKKVAPAKAASITDSINTEVIAAALSSVNQPIFLKVCRLCETKDGPFLNIFDADKITVKKIEVVMPFRITENDDLPHKICFRCSAKVEELYEFIQKCIRTQESLRKVAGAKMAATSKQRHRELWEEKLNKSNISNDDICDALIKKAMEGIKDIPHNQLPREDEDKAELVKKETKKTTAKEEKTSKNDNNEQGEKKFVAKPPKTDLAKQSTFTQKSLSLRSKSEIKSNNDIENKPSKVVEKEVPIENKIVLGKNIKPAEPVATNNENNKQISQTNTFSLEETVKDQAEPTFNIMDHVSMIKVNGVGVLFQCKICNRNFLKKEVVMSHACAKNGPSKIAGPKNFVPPEPPKIPSVKYINTKINQEVKKPVIIDDKPINLDDDDDEEEDDKPLVTKKLKPKIGPASKVKRNTSPLGASESSTNQSPGLIQVRANLNSTVQEPVVQFPTLPSLNSRYKLLPGPNNTFTLVEESVTNNTSTSSEKSENAAKSVSPDEQNNINAKSRSSIATRTNAARKNQDKPVKDNSVKTTEVSSDRPYPVGLFKTNNVCLKDKCSDGTKIQSEPAAFATPAMKKQSYTVVQTGNPSKLLISSKPKTPVEEVPKKRQRKGRSEVKTDPPIKQPYSVTIEDATPPRDAGFFTFINVDPLLQPSYVLPTDNIIQESQISTSSSVLKQSEKEKDHKYTCNMCNETFSREKKLLAHIQSHYSKMDEEDQMRTEKMPRKRKK